MTELIEKQLVNQAKTRGIPKASWQRADLCADLVAAAGIACLHPLVCCWLMGGAAALLSSSNAVVLIFSQLPSRCLCSLLAVAGEGDHRCAAGGPAHQAICQA
jgi:hypothetical protein